jgi:hypothetical protein
VNEIFPGYRDALVKAGGVPVSVARDIRFEHPEIGRLPQRELGTSLVCASRPLLELVPRQKAQAIANLEIRSGCKVTEIVSALSSANVQGVRLINQAGVSSSVDADLVVDASGPRGGLTAALFDTLKLELPETTAVDVNLFYTSAEVELPERATKNWKLVLTQNDPPRIGDRAVLVPMERNRWMVTICQRGRLERIDGWNQYVSAFRDLITPTIYDALRQAKPVEDLRQFAFPTSSWRHFERSARLPRGLFAHPRMPFAGSIRSTVRACPRQPCRQGCCAMSWRMRLPSPIQSWRCRKDSWRRSPPCWNTPGPCRPAATCSFRTRAGRGRSNFKASVEFESAMFRAAVMDPVVHKAAMDVNQLLQPRSLLQSPHIVERIEGANGAPLRLEPSGGDDWFVHLASAHHHPARLIVFRSCIAYGIVGRRKLAHGSGRDASFPRRREAAPVSTL